MSDDRAGIEQALDTLQAEDGTDISAALAKASEYTSQTYGPSFFRVLVISDGLSDREPAEEAAKQLPQGSAIDVLLIDPTDKGEEVARAIAIGGFVWAVTSPEELARDIGHAAQQQEKLAKQADAIMEK